MDNAEAVRAIKSNWPDKRYSTLREALELSIKLLEADELVQQQTTTPCSTPSANADSTSA